MGVKDLKFKKKFKKLLKAIPVCGRIIWVKRQIHSTNADDSRRLQQLIVELEELKQQLKDLGF
jgi:hypothetical protein